MFLSRTFDTCQRFFTRDGFFSHMPYGGIWGIALGLLLVAAVVLLIVLLVRNGKKNTPTPPTTKSNNERALDALKLKYANGEITEEEYLKRKQILSE